ncbi:hypothetical protein B0A54_13300 [Friedmanniomyces endolithicus]|uniref:Isotrichodermin C-15 hydroxylase n=1 Tax=Friedmanniomyces endolithicus TaxID=329885 RepID=A0A4U0UGG7_9PEZI|nr:hypothetical protein B0A54_13300 [Friedmanniomyces endolithicus]
MGLLDSIGRACLLLLGASFLYTSLRLIYNVFLHPLRKYPGPLLWKAARLRWVIALQKGYLHRDLLDLHNKYGPVVRIAPDELSYIDPQAWKDIYTTRLGHATIERGAVWFQKATPDEPFSIMGHNEEHHARYRRAFMGAFSDKAIKDQSPRIEEYVEFMMQKFREMARNGSTVLDIVTWLNFVTFDISGDLSFGRSFDSILHGQAHPWVEIAVQFGKGIALIASVNYYAPLQKLLKFVLPAKVREKIIYHRQLSAQKVQQRLELQETRQDFIGSVLKYNQEKTEEVTPKELELNMSIFVFAGSETTSTAIAAILFGLLKTPAALRKVTEEIRSSFDAEGDITVASTTGLHYLVAVISEGMRLGPPSAITPPRITPRGGVDICGELVPGGTFVAVNQYPAFRSSSNFSSPEEFRPERFLDKKSPENNLSAFHPFLIGRHQCIGQKFAWGEMRLILARMLYVFDISWATTPAIDDWGQQQTFIFWQKQPLEVRLTLR